MTVFKPQISQIPQIADLGLGSGLSSVERFMSQPLFNLWRLLERSANIHLICEICG